MPVRRHPRKPVSYFNAQWWISAAADQAANPEPRTPARDISFFKQKKDDEIKCYAWQDTPERTFGKALHNLPLSPVLVVYE
jgi:hypothetical protein